MAIKILAPPAWTRYARCVNLFTAGVFCTYNPGFVHTLLLSPYSFVPSRSTHPFILHGTRGDDPQHTPLVFKTASPGAEKHLRNEYAHLLQCHHPHIVRPQGLVRLDTGVCALVLEHVEGHTLEHTQGFSYTEALGLTLQLTWALSALQALDIVHGDVCPKNILYHQGFATLVDFGMAHPWHTPHNQGSVGFIAPEILREEASRTQDVYSLGAVLKPFLSVQWKPQEQQHYQALMQSYLHPDPQKRPLPHQAFALALNLAPENLQHTWQHIHQTPSTLPSLHIRDTEKRLAGFALQGYDAPFGVVDASEQDLAPLHACIPQKKLAPYTPHNPWPYLYALKEALVQHHRTYPLCLAFTGVRPQSVAHLFIHMLDQEQTGIPCVHTMDPEENFVLSLEDTQHCLQESRPLHPEHASCAQQIHHTFGGNPYSTHQVLAYKDVSVLPLRSHNGTLDTMLSQKPSLETSTPEELLFLSLTALMPGAAPCALMQQAGGAYTSYTRSFLTEHVYPHGLYVSFKDDETRAFFEQQAHTSMVADALKRVDAQAFPALYVHSLILYACEGRDVETSVSVLKKEAHKKLEEGAPLQALKIHTLLLKRTPNIDVRVDLANLHNSMGQYDQTLELLASFKTHPEAQVLYVETLIKKGFYEQACEASLVGHVTTGHNSMLHALHARALLLKGDYVQSAHACEAWLLKHPNHPHTALFQNTLSLCWLYQGKHTQADRTIQDALQNALKTHDPQLIETIRASAGLIFQKNNKPEESEAMYLSSLEEAQKTHNLPREIVRLTNLGTLAQDNGQWKKALECYEKAQQKALLCQGHREYIRIVLNHANLRVFLGDTSTAHALLASTHTQAEALHMHVEHAYLQLVMAENLIEQAHTAQAESLLQKAQTFFSTHNHPAGVTEALLLNAWNLLRQNKPTEAFSLAQQALREAKTLARPRIALKALHLLAWTQPNTYLADFLQSARALKDNDSVWIGLCMQGDFETAHTHYNRCLQEIDASLQHTYTSSWTRINMATLLQQWTDAQNLPHDEGLQKILVINRSLAQEHHVDTVLQRIIDEALAMSGAERGFILLSQDNGLHVCAQRHFNHTEPSNPALNLSVSIAQKTILSEQPVTSLNAQSDQRFVSYPSVHALHIKSVLCVPLKTHEGVLGALYLDHRTQADIFSKKHVFLLQAFADQASIALSTARLIEQLTSHSQELEQSQARIDALNVQLQQELKAKDEELSFIHKMHGTHITISTHGKHGMIGTSSAMQHVYRLIDRVAGKDVPVYIEGESGTGKELVARAVHECSAHKNGPFISVNCGAIPSDLLESELFGHERGAFTGAVRDKPGLFEAAHDGTLFLDEIGEMSLHMQVKLLRALQDTSVRRIGSTHTRPIRTRIVSATNKNLLKLVKEGLFREDLWYRINVVAIHLPPLRERSEDLPLLIEHMLKKHATHAPPKISRAAYRLLLEHTWPGNIRELENEIQRALALYENTIMPEDFSLQPPPSFHTLSTNHDLKTMVEQFEKATIVSHLEENRGKVARTAEVLGLTRAGLYKKLHKYDINVRE